MINHLNWESLEDRHDKASLHTFYKMFNNLTTIPYIQYVQLSTVTSIRYSHPFKLMPMLAKKNPLKYSFLSRTIPLWNQLPQDLVNSNSLISFKNKLDDYRIEQNFGGKNFWRNCDFEILAEKTLANPRLA